MLYPTIVNNIPKDSNVYDNTMDDYAKLDNKLAASQLDIGESSNLAQLAQTYDCTFDEQKYKDYICILSVLAQIAIDSSKRLFDVDVGAEIKRIKRDMDVKNNKYPAFWKIIHREFKEKNINYDLQCPMNYLYDLKLDQFRSLESTIPIEYFIISQPLNLDKRICKRIEKLICDFSMQNYQTGIENEDYLLLRADFDKLVESIRLSSISKNYKGFVFWILDRTFSISSRVKANQYKLKSKIKKNRSLMIKALYDTNKKLFLDCFIDEVSFNKIH